MNWPPEKDFSGKNYDLGREDGWNAWRKEGYNQALADCKSAFEKQGLKPLDRKTWMDMMMPFHGGNPDTWAKSLDKIYEDYFDPKTHKSSQRFGAPEGTK